jgi:hypothetical protein
MRLSTASNYLNHCKLQMDSIFRSAIHHMPTAIELREEFNKVYSSDQFTRMPDWAKSSVRQHHLQILERIYREHTMQLYVLPNGDKVITQGAWDSFPEEMRESARNGGKLPLKFFWCKVEETCTQNGVVTRTSTPTDKVYYESVE